MTNIRVKRPVFVKIHEDDRETVWQADTKVRRYVITIRVAEMQNKAPWELTHCGKCSHAKTFQEAQDMAYRDLQWRIYQNIEN